MSSILLNLQKVEKEELKNLAKSQRRSVNTILNIAVEEYIERCNK